MLWYNFLCGDEIMKEVFNQLLTDLYVEDLPHPIPRAVCLRKLPKMVRKAHIFVGMRRSGKTWVMYQHMQSLIDSGVDKCNILYLNFEDDRLSSMKVSDFQSILDAYFTLYPELINSNDLHFFFDEIHEINGWEKFIRRLLDKEKMEVYISGSSAKLLSKEIASSLRGRTIVYEIFPFSFAEFLRSKGIDYSVNISTKQKARIVHYSKEFLLYGGFPEALSIEKNFFIQLLQGYINTVIYRDIIERYNIGNISIVHEFIVYCLQNCVSLLSLHKIYQRFKSQKKSVGKALLYELIGYLEDVYCIFSVPLYTYSFNKRSLNPKKIYAVDQGLITAYTIKPAFEYSARLENAVFCALRRKSENIFYYKTKTGYEIDFVVILSSGKNILIQVCTNMRNNEISEREIRSLISGMEELNIKEATIITTDEERVINDKHKLIHCVPYWKWVLRE